MAVPERIPINHEPGHPTDTIGPYERGDYLASVTAGFREDYRIHDEDWPKHNRWFA